jgi:intraflagellar transport protein 172
MLIVDMAPGSCCAHHADDYHLLCGNAGKWEAAQKVARGYLPQAELQRFYSRRAREFEAAQQWKDAEKAYLAAGEVDMAVNMYKKNKMWENMLRLVQQHRKEGLQQAHLLVAQVGGQVVVGHCSCLLVPATGVLSRKQLLL